MPMGYLGLASENSSSPWPAHVSPDLSCSHWRGSPPRTGTTQVSRLNCGSTTVYAIVRPSGENAGSVFLRESLVSCTGSPSGNRLTYIWPNPYVERGPRTNASILPSAEIAG